VTEVGVTRDGGLLEARGLSVGYAGHPVVHDFEITVHSSEVVALLGPNGAGKTTTLLGLAGELPALRGDLRFANLRRKAPLHRRARAGLAFVTEERSVFMRLTVLENLRIGRCDVDVALGHFPELGKLLKQTAGSLSGGEQQMLTLARALARAPRLLLADELSLGLAPLVIQRLLRAVRQAADDQGIGAIIVEQQLKQALEVADRCLVMQRGRVVLDESSTEVAKHMDKIEALYFEV
jgi:branched-chain amino acid transport system ATP-binding protein